MAWERIAENRIREAMQAGELDNLPGARKPIDLEGYFKLPEHRRRFFIPEERQLRAGGGPAAQRDRDPRTTARRRRRRSETAIRRALANRRTQLAVILERARR